MFCGLEHGPPVFQEVTAEASVSVCVGVCYIQMLLPEGIRRENTKLCEEVEIPPSQPMPVGFEEKPVYISELDEVGTPSLCLCCSHTPVSEPDYSSGMLGRQRNVTSNIILCFIGF